MSKPKTSGPLKPNMDLRNYDTRDDSIVQGSWRSVKEIPRADEILSLSMESDGQEAEKFLPANIIDGPWESKETYLRAHYELLREDAVAPLRDAVAEVRRCPWMQDKRDVCIYEQAYVLGITFSRRGLALRMAFSTARSGKAILWEQSKRLVPGTLVALSPVDDAFQNDCIIAVVAARPLVGLQADPPEVDLFLAEASEFEIDPMKEWMMVESRTGYFEAYRHTLTALQKLMSEKFPMSDYLVGLRGEVGTPKYVQRNPFANLTTLFPMNGPGDTSHENTNVLTHFPTCHSSVLDSSQQIALERILTKELALVQGPPGTGKTHVSVSALKILLGGLSDEEPPIIIASQTNHALDQLLRHVAEFEPNFVRIGGRTADQDVIKKRTLFEVSRQTKAPVIPGNLRTPAIASLRRHEERVKALLAPLRDQSRPLSAELLLKFGLLTEAQYESLRYGDTDWIRVGNEASPQGSIGSWLGSSLERFTMKMPTTHFPQEPEAVDLEIEQLKEWEAETKGGNNEDERIDALSGTWFPITERFTGRCEIHVRPEEVHAALRIQDIWKIPERLRGAIYVYLQTTFKQIICASVRQEAQEYARAVRQYQIGKWEVDSAIIARSKVVGLTTTALSKYRPLIESLKPRVVVVEEAAETLEGLIAAGCIKSLEHLILVGDHQQLRGSCAVADLAEEPFNLGVSMFERLVTNGVEFSMLSKQRRMIPEISRMIKPIYEHLEDYSGVCNRTDVPGMGGINSYFFTHHWREGNDAQSSFYNPWEADMVVGLFAYLVLNGTRAADITVLTFYNGQRKRILQALRAHPDLHEQYYNVKTVDSYQGEENEIILLSLVRCNADKKIGFVGLPNRICVAMSRARRGFYLFGSAETIGRCDTLWWKILRILSDEPKRIGYAFPITCSGHGNTSWIKEPHDWLEFHGGCEMPCNQPMPCGHTCIFKCHPFEHDQLICSQPCMRTLPCGHKCQAECGVTYCQCPCNRGVSNRRTAPALPAMPVLPEPNPNANGRQKPTAKQPITVLPNLQFMLPDRREVGTPRPLTPNKPVNSNGVKPRMTAELARKPPAVKQKHRVKRQVWNEIWTPSLPVSKTNEQPEHREVQALDLDLETGKQIEPTNGYTPMPKPKVLFEQANGLDVSKADTQEPVLQIIGNENMPTAARRRTEYHVKGSDAKEIINRVEDLMILDSPREERFPGHKASLDSPVATLKGQLKEHFDDQFNGLSGRPMNMNGLRNGYLHGLRNGRVNRLPNAGQLMGISNGLLNGYSEVQCISNGTSNVTSSSSSASPTILAEPSLMD
ncbi:MAG: hypothetical protein M1825_002031 [Sarcosagium campestre]|nr:MAG: hypothetical protein M1825_002031 [Sarcosagium campestre]